MISFSFDKTQICSISPILITLLSQQQYKISKMNQEFIKLLIIGDSGVGKSCILSRYCEDKFSTAFFNTIGVDFKTKQMAISNTKCKMQIWDTAGQQRFRTITSNYYRGAHGILVVFDVTSKTSFRDVDYWLTEIQRHGNQGSVVIILVGNKCDLVGKREVSEDEASGFARKNNIQYIEVSALNSSNVSLVFETIAKHVLRKKLGSKVDTPKMDGKKQISIQKEGGRGKDKKQCC